MDPVIIDIPKGAYVAKFQQRQSPADTHGIFPKIRPNALLAVPVTLVVLATVYTVYQAFEGSPAFRSPVSVAVLPFSNLSSDPENQYFSDGLGEEVIGRLMKTEHVRIIRWIGKVDDVRELGRKLKVRAVLTGSVQKSGQRVRVTASLTDAGEGHRLWAEVYDREHKDVFAIQTEVAREIATALGVELGSRNRRPATLNLQAFDLYLQGRYLLNWKDVATTKRAIAKFQEASAADPAYAAPYAGLADCYLRLMWLDAVPPVHLLPKLRAATMEALRLDPESAEARESLAAYLDWNRDYQGSERELRRAIQLNPNYALAIMSYGLGLAAQGHHQEGLVHTRRAMELEPHSLAAAFALGVQLLWARRYQEAADQLQRAVEVAPTSSSSHHRLASVHLARGMHDQAIAEFQKAVDLSGRAPDTCALLAHAYAVSGRTAEANKLLQELIARAEHDFVAPLALARVYLGLGEQDRALEWVERAYAQPASSAWRMHLLDPMFDDVRAHPRFTVVLKKLHLPVS